MVGKKVGAAKRQVWILGRHGDAVCGGILVLTDKHCLQSAIENYKVKTLSTMYSYTHNVLTILS